MAKHSKCDLCGAQSFEITPQVAETRLRIAALEADCARLRENAERWANVLNCAYENESVREKQYVVMPGQPHQGGDVKREFTAAIDAARREKT